MAVIEYKLHSEYYDQINSGKKKFELRLNDREVNEGDILLLREWDRIKNEYTGRNIEKTVTRVNKFRLEDFYKYWTKEDIEEKGIMIMSIE